MEDKRINLTLSPILLKTVERAALRLSKQTGIKYNNQDAIRHAIMLLAGEAR